MRDGFIADGPGHAPIFAFSLTAFMFIWENTRAHINKVCRWTLDPGGWTSAAMVCVSPLRLRGSEVSAHQSVGLQSAMASLLGRRRQQKAAEPSTHGQEVHCQGGL